jgi:D-inositol-3-phosphate glycosyltransferase
MKIHLVSENAGPVLEPEVDNPGVQQVHVRALALALARAEHDVTLWTRRDAPDRPDTVELADAVRLRHVDAGPARPLAEAERIPHLPALAAALRAAWTRDRPDVVHAHSWTSGMVAVAAARDVGAPVVLTFHSLATVARRNLRSDDGSPAGRIRMEGSLARAADRLVATSSEQAAELVRLGAPRRLVQVVPHGVDTDAFTPDGRALPRGERPRIVYAGRMLPSRGVDEAVAALAAVPAAELVLAGDFGSDDRVRLEGLARRHGVRDRMLLVEQLPRSRVPELLRSADVVVCVPWFEQFGMVALEAMACARPVVASAVGGLADTVVDGVTGAHVAPRRPAELAAALRTVLGCPMMTQALGVAGRDRAVVRYGWERIADATAEVYQRVVEDAGTPVH